MFKRVQARKNGTEKQGAVNTALAVEALARNLHIMFTDHGWYVSADGEQKPIETTIYSDGKPVEKFDPFIDRIIPARAYFPVLDGIRAIAESLGLEFRAEYVVGSSEPQLKAVKTPKK